jgi:hypothetical protein
MDCMSCIRTYQNFDHLESYKGVSGFPVLAFGMSVGGDRSAVLFVDCYQMS